MTKVNISHFLFCSPLLKFNSFPPKRTMWLLKVLSSNSGHLKNVNHLCFYDSFSWQESLEPGFDILCHPWCEFYKLYFKIFFLTLGAMSPRFWTASVLKREKGEYYSLNMYNILYSNDDDKYVYLWLWNIDDDINVFIWHL